MFLAGKRSGRCSIFSVALVGKRARLASLWLSFCVHAVGERDLERLKTSASRRRSAKRAVLEPGCIKRKENMTLALYDPLAEAAARRGGLNYLKTGVRTARTTRTTAHAWSRPASRTCRRRRWWRRRPVRRRRLARR